MAISIHQYVLEELSKTKGTWPDIAEATGISYRTLEKIAREESKNPGIGNIEKLADYFLSLGSAAKAPPQALRA